MFLVKLKRKISKYPVIFNSISFVKLHLIGFYYRFFMLLFSLFSINNSKVIIISYSGKGYSDNGKYIAEELRKIRKLKIYWASHPKYKNSLPSDIMYTKMNSIEFLYHLSTAKVWVNNSRFVFGIRKRKKQFYIQTWHSSLRLKKIEKDAEASLNPQYIRTCKADSKMIDLIISGCEFSSNTYKNSFWYNGEILNCGTPRCDIFFKKDIIKNIKKKICKQYKLDISKKNILYAPTFRKNVDESKVYINCSKLLKNLNGQYNLLVRFHPISKYTIENKDVINVTDYPDMQELIAISDFLITDYSGCCFDMLIKGDPCILFTKDKKEYFKKERNLYFSLEELPFPKVEDEIDLAKMIDNFDYEQYNNNILKFEEKIKIYEKGIASKTIAKIIEGKCNVEKV